MVHKKNRKSRATNQTTTLPQKKDVNVLATIKLAGKATETTDNGNQPISEVVMQ